MSSISPSLMKAIREYARQHPELAILGEAVVDDIAESLAAAYVKDRGSLWWWESLRSPFVTEAYGDNDGLGRVEEILGRLRGPFTLIITDDERPPWEAVRGPLKTLVAMLREHQCFEFCIVNDTLAWALFDTHHNSLVVAGYVPGYQPE